jgi:hypothetical protein
VADPGDYAIGDFNIARELLVRAPETASILERVRVIVTYVEGVPKRMTDGFGLLANEAMANAWPCKS